MKCTAVAHSNIAFTKYWGKQDEVLRIPANSNISMNLSDLYTTTTVEFHTSYSVDEIIIDGKKDEKETQRVVTHLNTIRKKAGITQQAKVMSQNTFPTSTGLSSSASGFAALTLAAVTAAGLQLKDKELSILARLGSGSACRSIPDGFVEWVKGESSESSYAYSIYPKNHWDIVDIVLIVSDEKKIVPTTDGHKLAWTSPFFKDRLLRMNEKNILCKKYIAERDFKSFGTLVESEALEMHAVMITSKPSLIYWLPHTVFLMKQIQFMRKNGLEIYFTVNTGQDLHVLCEKKHLKRAVHELSYIKEIKKCIINTPSEGAKLSTTHLF